jgi:riboflavin kinase
LLKIAQIEVLIPLAKEGAQRGAIRISLDWLARRLSTSRQTAARRLAELESEGLIERDVEPSGQKVRITSSGLAALRAFHQELGSVIKPESHPMILSGRVVTGVGEGSYYMSQTHYVKQFEKEAGFVPYPGTLDIKLDRDSIALKEVITRLPSREVPGFKTKERAFGPVRFFPAKLKNLKVALILPLRSHYTDIIELIAPQNLRESLGLKDGDLVHVEVRV